MDIQYLENSHIFVTNKLSSFCHAWRTEWEPFRVEEVSDLETLRKIGWKYADEKNISKAITLIFQDKFDPSSLWKYLRGKSLKITVVVLIADYRYVENTQSY